MERPRLSDLPHLNPHHSNHSLLLALYFGGFKAETQISECNPQRIKIHALEVERMTSRSKSLTALLLLFSFFFLNVFFLLLFLLLSLLLPLLGLLARLLHEDLLHPLQFLEAERNLLEHLVAFVLLPPELSGEGGVLILHLLHARVVLVGDLDDLVHGHGLLGRTVAVVQPHHPRDLPLQLLRLRLVALRQLRSLPADLAELLQLLRGHLLLQLALHSNYYKPPKIGGKANSKRADGPSQTGELRQQGWRAREERRGSGGVEGAGELGVQYMLSTEKSRDLSEQIARIQRRMGNVKEVRQQQSDYLTELQELLSSYAQRTHKEVAVFEEAVVKHTLYASSQVAPIVNQAKLHRDFLTQLDRTARLHLLALQRIRPDEIAAQEGRLARKCELFLKEFGSYMAGERAYNEQFGRYSGKCAVLEQTIRRYRSYQDPLAFYNHSRTSEYIAELDRQHNDCANHEAALANHAQQLDQTRKWMADHVKEINEYYVILLHLHLSALRDTLAALLEPAFPADPALALREQPDLPPSTHADLEKLNTLYASEANHHQLEGNLLEDYSQLFKNSFVAEVSSDSKFFYDRCDSMRGRKLKATEEVLRIQGLLVAELARQTASLAVFEKNYRAVERDIFTNNGIDSFKKRFRKYFGSNFMEALELCLAVVDRQKRSLDRLAKSTEDSREKLGRLVENKQESVRLFERRTRTVLDDHLRLKEKTLVRNPLEDDVRAFRDSIAPSFAELKKSFQELERSEAETDALFYSTLKAHSQVIQRQGTARNLNRVLEKEKVRLAILRGLNVDGEIILILKEDSRYEMLMNECPKPNLYASFQSQAQKKEYDETKRLLQMKEDRLKGMIRSRQGCCGITSEPIKQKVLSQHKCKLVANNSKAKGTINITAAGLIFEEITWMPFSEGLRLAIPQGDILSFDTRALNGKEVVEVGTDFGSLFFESKECGEIIESMQKNITFKPGKEASEKGKRSDSASFLKNNTSTEFKLSYDKSNQGSSTDAFRNNKNAPRPKPADQLKDFIRKWREESFLGEHFTRIVKNPPEKEGGRRDYQFSSGANRFVLKERREGAVEGKDVVLSYEWKVCFPDSQMLRSFKHSQRVHIEGVAKDLRVRILTARLTEEQLFIRNRFYREIEEMNARLNKFIVNAFEKEADVLIEHEDDGSKSLDSCQIIVCEPNDDKPDRGDNTLRSSRLQRCRSGNLTSSGFRAT